MKKTLSLILLATATLPAAAQKFDTHYLTENLSKTVYPLDSFTDAIVLFEKKTVTISKNVTGYTSNTHVHKLYKILRQSGAPVGEIAELYRSNNQQKVSHLKAFTFNFVNDELNETQLEEKSAEVRRLDTNYSQYSFSMPAIKTGTVFEYEFDITATYDSTFPQWEMRGTLPKLHTELEIIAPAELKLTEQYPAQFNFITNIGTDVVKNIKYTATRATENKDGMSHQVWSRDNLEAFKKEQFVSSPGNYAEWMEPTLAGHTQDKIKKEWGALNTYMMQHERFGALITDEDARLKKVADSLTRNIKYPLEKARRIYSYVRQAFDCNNNPGIYSRREAGQIIKNKIAGTAEINLVLCALMHQAGLEANPVLVSLLGAPRANLNLATSGQFGYTVCRVRVDFFDYYLDGSNPFNCFGVLPVFCYNGPAWVAGENGGTIQLNNRDFKDTSTVDIHVSDVTDSSMVFTVTEKKGRTEGIYLRSVLTRDSTMLREYLKKRVQNFPGQQKLLSYGSDNLMAPDEGLVVTYSLYSKTKSGPAFSFPTDILKIFSGNPFQTSGRVLPVEFPSCHDYNYKLVMDVPSIYKPTNLPPASSATAAGDAIRFGHRVDYNSATKQITVQTHFTITEPNFPAAKYTEVKAFFDKMTKEVYSTILFGPKN